jgi:hypothetical protein
MQAASKQHVVCTISAITVKSLAFIKAWGYSVDVKLVSCDSYGHTNDVTSLAPWVSYLRNFDSYCVMRRKKTRERAVVSEKYGQKSNKYRKW